jgi:hypothetical protein
MTNPIIQAFIANDVFSFEGRNAIRFPNGQIIRLGENAAESRKLIMKAIAWLKSGTPEAVAVNERIAAWKKSHNFTLPDFSETPETPPSP